MLNFAIRKDNIEFIVHELILSSKYEKALQHLK
jgi:hypothetical protein